MSYNVSLKINTGIKNKSVIGIGNMTWNVAEMYYKAMGKSLLDLDNLLVKDVVPILAAGICNMIKNKSDYVKLNPPNGWGSYDDALEFLMEILKECTKNPLCILVVN